MMKSRLRERFEQRGQVRDVGLVQSGSREIVTLRLSDSRSSLDTVGAIVALRRRGVPTLKAKRAVEAAMERRASVVDVPTVESVAALTADLARTGFGMACLNAQAVDVRRIRERLRLTQEQFALHFGIELDTIRNWEQGRREPDATARSYLMVIDKDPEAVEKALTLPMAG